MRGGGTTDGLGLISMRDQSKCDKGEKEQKSIVFQIGFSFMVYV